MRYPCKEVHDNAKGHSAGQKDMWRMDLSGVLQQNKNPVPLRSTTGIPKGMPRKPTNPML